MPRFDELADAADRERGPALEGTPQRQRHLDDDASVVSPAAGPAGHDECAVGAEARAGSAEVGP